jgi:hypothetical protein
MHRAQAVLTEPYNLAYAVASSYRASHPLLDLDDSRGIAAEVVATMAAAGRQLTAYAIRDAVRNALFVELRSLKRERERTEQIAADEYGNPLSSLLELRGADSLNPNSCRRYSSNQPTHTDPRPHIRSFLEALKYVRASAPIQCGNGSESEYYRFRSGENRERVKVESRREGQRKQYRLKIATQAA